MTEENGTDNSPGPNEDAVAGDQPIAPFDAGDAEELCLTEKDIIVLEREGLRTAKSIRALKDPGFLAGLCGWDKNHAIRVINRANALRTRELHNPKARGNNGQQAETD